MADWNPDLYRLFEDERTRPARDLLAEVDHDSPTDVVDLGCGPGNSTELLARRFPAARLCGIDTSEAMLESARARLPGVDFLQADIRGWTAPGPLDLLYANAVLQWLPDHETLLPRLLSMLRPGGVLAVQMPDNAEEPSHRLMREIALDGPWRGRLEPVLARPARKVLTPAAYYDLLAPLAADVAVWRTAYHHPLPRARGIVDWLRSTGLKPFVDPLPEAERAAFLARYEAAVGAAYPARADGRRLLVFPRLFVVARGARPHPAATHGP